MADNNNQARWLHVRALLSGIATPTPEMDIILNYCKSILKLATNRANINILSLVILEQ